MAEQRIESVKKEVRSLLISYQKGLSLVEFLKSYRSLLGVRLPSREFGYTSDLDFLHSLPDVVHIQVDNNGLFQLFGIADANTEHIKKLVGKQRSIKPKPNFKSSSFANNKRISSTALINSRERCRPFVPALLRAEIIRVVEHYPDGIGYQALAEAYKNVYNKPLNLEWLSSSQLDRLGKLVNAVPELELKIMNGLEKMFLCIQKCNTNTLSNGSVVPGSSRNIRQLKETSKTNSAKPNCGLSSKEVLSASTVSENIKFNIEKVLKQYPQGLLAVHFPILYEKVTQQSFDLHEMGFINLFDLLDSLPDIVFRRESPESSRDWILFHVVNSANASNFGSLSRPSSQTPVQNSSHYHSKTNFTVGIAPPDLEYIQPEVPQDGGGMFIPVFVSAFINPSLFWFQLQTDEAVESLCKLEDEMEFFYNSQPRRKYQMADVDVLIGASCVAFCSTDHHWYRAVISSLPNLEYINVLFVDYGSWEKVPRSMLFYLKYSFFRFPAHAFKAKLAALRPPSQKGVWGMEAQNRFLQLCNKTTIMAKIDSIENQTFSVFLCDSSDDEEVHINDTMLMEGYAEHCAVNGENGALSPHFDHVPENGFKFNSPPCSKLKEEAAGSEVEVNQDKSGFSLLNGIRKLNLQSKISSNKKSIKRVQLGDGYRVHLVLVSDEAFVTGDDVCNLLWCGKTADVLACRLEFKEVDVPTISIEKKVFPDLFMICERSFLNGFDNTKLNYSVTLYPLTSLIKILNTFGHPSVEVRDTISREVKNFDPSDLSWVEKLELDSNQEECQDMNQADKLKRSCLYDLKTMQESFHCKKLKLLDDYERKKDENLVKKLKNLEFNQSCIAKRIEEIKLICTNYS